MTTTIAVAGKGGVGKTMVSAMVIKYLSKLGNGAILAIDADPSTNLHMVLGLEVEWTVGDIREDMLEKVQSTLGQGGAAMGGLPGGQTKREHLDYEIRSSVAEGSQFDLIAMGRPEGPGCYCAVNHNLRDVIDAISKNYRWVVIDNEAGLEHLSRRTTRDVQHLLVVTDPTLRGIVAAERVAEFKSKLESRIENAHLILNRVPGELPAVLRDRVDQLGIPLLGTIPETPEVTEFEFTGRPVIELPEESAVYGAVEKMLQAIL